MLNPLITGQHCAKCRLCCEFDRDDIWELPVFTPEVADAAAALAPDAPIHREPTVCTFSDMEYDENGLVACPMLATDGCRLGADKPFDCKIWPFRVMRAGEDTAIAVAGICDTITQKPLAELLSFLQGGLADTIFSYAKEHPEIIKPWMPGYVLLMREAQS